MARAFPEQFFRYAAAALIAIFALAGCTATTAQRQDAEVRSSQLVPCEDLPVETYFLDDDAVACLYIEGENLTLRATADAARHMFVEEGLANLPAQAATCLSNRAMAEVVMTPVDPQDDDKALVVNAVWAFAPPLETVDWSEPEHPLERAINEASSAYALLILINQHGVMTNFPHWDEEVDDC
ncbi:MAG: hypothetical protein CVT64_06935 [Actinobacteria bacterium HGW-Actinobacteria-4]|nr:MAG: hypothetical protein CVT64_06935 [Actinobacteria bacterium HGW-Actinobacteria-4]